MVSWGHGYKKKCLAKQITLEKETKKTIDDTKRKVRIKSFVIQMQLEIDTDYRWPKKKC